MPTVHAFFLPGMFGFGQLAGYDYFCHLERALEARFRDAGVELRPHVIALPPTASLKRRAARVADVAATTPGSEDTRIVFVGHSTGGLDARLLLSPSASLAPHQSTGWRRRVRALASINTPHHGTPLAGYFTTVSGTRLLYAMSLLTVASLTLGKLPLTAFASLVAAVGRIDERIGIEVKLLDELTDLVLRVLGEQGRDEVHAYLSNLSKDQGGIVQLMPESMELFNATVQDRPGVRYGCIATSAPAPQPLKLLGRIRSPIQALSAAVFSTMWTVTARPHAAYPQPLPPEKMGQALAPTLGTLSSTLNDGVVPTLSMLRGELIWAGVADHLDVVGHFRDDHKPAEHVDWLTSGAHFDRSEHAAMCDALATFLLDACA